MTETTLERCVYCNVDQAVKLTIKEAEKLHSVTVDKCTKCGKQTGVKTVLSFIEIL